MNLPLNDRETQTLLTALELLRSVKQDQVFLTEKSQKIPLNEYDLLDAKHTLMHTLMLLSKLTKKPIEHFANPNPSQSQPTPTTPEFSPPHHQPQQRT